ncbi:MAG: UDP-N-acetylmuramate dehydrogenase [Flavobacteriales bacterium]
MISENVSLKSYNTFGIYADARYFSAFETIEEAKELLQHKIAKSAQLLVLGGGSNLLLTRNFDGLVMKNNLKGIELVREDDLHYYVKSMAGENWHDFVLYCVAKRYAGIENLSLIPGCVGASPMQNIGAYGVEIKDVFCELEALHIKTGEIHRFGLNDCNFGYRESVFKRQYKGEYIILSVLYRLNKTPKLNTSYGAIEQEMERTGVVTPTIKDVSDAVVRIRSSKLPNPAEIGNAGSFFKNPVITKEHASVLLEQYSDLVHYPATRGMVKLAAGWLIEKAGWKGYMRNNHGVHKHQALVLVNYGGATGQEIYLLSEEIMADVRNKFGVELEREVNIL